MVKFSTLSKKQRLQDDGIERKGGLHHHGDVLLVLPWMTTYEKTGQVGDQLHQILESWHKKKPLKEEKHTLRGINISHLGKRKIIFKMPFWGDMLISWRVVQTCDSLKIQESSSSFHTCPTYEFP